MNVRIRQLVEFHRKNYLKRLNPLLETSVINGGDYIRNDALIVVKNVNIDFIAPANGPITFVGHMDDEQKSRAIDNARNGVKVEELIQVKAIDLKGDLVSKSVVTTYISPKK